MFQCQKCGNTSKPREKSYMAVTEIRSRKYAGIDPNIEQPHSKPRPPYMHTFKADGIFVQKHMHSGEGWEIKQALRTCKACYDIHNYRRPVLEEVQENSGISY